MSREELVEALRRTTHSLDKVLKTWAAVSKVKARKYAELGSTVEQLLVINKGLKKELEEVWATAACFQVDVDAGLKAWGEERVEMGLMAGENGRLRRELNVAEGRLKRYEMVIDEAAEVWEKERVESRLKAVEQE